MDRLVDAAAASTYPENVTVFAFFKPSVASDFFHFMIKGADHGAVPARPDLFSDVLGGDFVVGAFDFDVAVAVDLAGSFFKVGDDLLLRSAVDAFFGEAFEGFASQGVVFDAFDAAFDFALSVGW